MSVSSEKMYPTVQLERELLKFLIRDKLVVQKYHSCLKSSWMTSEPRKVFLHYVIESFERGNSLLSRDVFEYELNKKYDAELDEIKIKDYLLEYDYINKLVPADNPELLIDRLEEADLANGVKSLLESAYLKLESGDVDNALGDLKSGALGLKRREDRGEVVSLHADIGDFLADLRNRRDFPERYTGIKTGLKKFDDLTGGLYKAELTIIFGLSGKGKSTVIKNIGANVRANNYNVLHVTNEENKNQVRTKYFSLESGIEYNKFKRGQYTDEEYDRFVAFNAEAKTKGGELFVLEIPQQTDATLIERAFIELKMLGKKIDLIIIDYMDLMSPIHRAYSENDEQAKVTNDCKGLAISCDVPVLSCTQAGTNVEKQETKERPFLTAADIYGTKRKVHCANTLIGIVNQTATVAATERTIEERKRHKVVFCVPKNRDGPVFTFRQIIEVETGKIVDDDDEFDPDIDKLEKKTLAITAELDAKDMAITASEIKKENDREIESLIKNVEETLKTTENEIPKIVEEKETFSFSKNKKKIFDIIKKRA